MTNRSRLPARGASSIRWQAAVLSGLLLFATMIAARAEPLDRVVDCRAASEIAERAEGLPDGLLLAIGKIETGRPNPATGAIEPWPWATNQGGTDHYFNSAQEAIAWTSLAQSQGLRSIDVGCFQINLMYHPDAFATLDEAFDPVANALYAARFLTALYRRAGGWPLAVAQYHSADPALGGPYGERVYSAWNGTWPGGFATRVAAPASVGVAGFDHTTLTARITNVADPFVIRIAVQAVGARVILPSWANAPVAPVAIPLGRANPLPTIGIPSATVPRNGGPLRMVANAGAARVADPVTVRMPRSGRLPRVYEPSGSALH